MFGFGPGEICAVVNALVWSAAVILFRKSGESVSPFALNFFKNSVALALFLVTLPIIGVAYAPAEARLEDWLTLLASGALGIGIADSLFFASLNRLGATGSAIVDCLYSPFVVVAAFCLIGEVVRWPLVLGVALMVIAILLGTSRANDGTSRRHDARAIATGVALGALSMALMAVGIVVAKPVLERFDPWWAATVRLVGGTVLLLVQGLAPANRRLLIAAWRPSRAWRYTVPGAIIGAYVAMLLWVAGFKLTSAGTAGVLNQTSSIFTMILAAIFLRERVTVRKAAGIVAAFAGAVVVVT
ncbi:MAG: DMT family transporter [Deltaproteobacteria bacterium]|nr:DMT family transporter [Deltaproteobacteria bacterium]